MGRTQGHVPQGVKFCSWQVLHNQTPDCDCNLCSALGSGPASSWDSQLPGELTSVQVPGPPPHEARPKAPSSS